jgi:serine protease Do
VDSTTVSTTEALIREIAAREPGTAVKLNVTRDGRTHSIMVKLTERPGREDGQARDESVPPVNRNAPRTDQDNPLGMSVQDLSFQIARRWNLPRSLGGVLVTHVDALSPADDAGMRHGDILLEINRRLVSSVGDYRRILAAVRPGDVLALYVYAPETGQRALRTLRVEPRQ